MTDIREAREVEELIARAIHWDLDTEKWPTKHFHARAIEDASHVIAALSEAGITLCREQVGWLDPGGRFHPRLRDDEHLARNGYVRLFDPVSEE